MTTTGNGIAPNPTSGTPSSPRSRVPLVALLFVVTVVGSVLYFAFSSRSATTGPAATAPDGRIVYQSHCAMCHQDDGKGMTDTYPPLVKTEYVDGSPETLINIVLHGMQGPITVGGVKYNGLMPAKKEIMSDAEVSAALNYVRTTFGSAGANASPVTATMSQQVRNSTMTRNEPWRIDELPKK